MFFSFWGLLIKLVKVLEVRWFIVLLVLANIVAFFWRDTTLNIIGIVPMNKQVSVNSAIPVIALDNEADTSVTDKSDEQKKSEINTAEEISSIEERQRFNPEDLCWFVGVNGQANVLSQDERALLNTLNERFAVLGIRANLRDVEVITAVRHIVYMPANAGNEKASVSETQSLPLLQQMLAKGHDAFLIRSGPLKGAVALGSYPSLALAERALADYQSEGIKVKAKVENEYEQKPRLVMTEADHTKLSSKLWGRLRLDWPEIFKEKKYCQSVAP